MKIILRYSLLFCLIHQVGFSQDSDSITHEKKWLKASVAPALLFGGSLYSGSKALPLNKYDIQKSIISKYPNFHSSVDDFTVHAPILFPYALDFLIKDYAKNDFLNRSILLFKSEVIMMALVYPIKYFVNEPRPDGSEYKSFPSGHTAQAFVAATFMHEELKHKSIWYSIGAYTIASSVGAFRLLNNRHWTSDVLAGAAIGIISTKIAYLTHKYKWGKKENGIQVSFIPIYY